jgi:TP53 regulating kinase-like protein
VILKEYIPGETIDHLVLKGEITAEIQRQIQALADLARAHGLNLDYYPTNFIFYKGTLYYIDYECNNYDEQWSFEKWGREVTVIP